MSGGVIRRKELADRLGVWPNTIWRWEKKGKSPVKPKKLVRTGEVVYSEDDVKVLKQWMNEATQA
jgi:transcriptional regulator with XRE-family HTH domain